MRALLRRVALVAGALVALFVAALTLAWLLLPRDWISAEAKRQVARMSGASITWASLAPGFEGLSLGVRIKDLAIRSPSEGPPRVNARVKELFVRFHLVPLLLRRVEVAAARVRGAGVALTAPPGGEAAAGGAGGGGREPAHRGLAVVLPRLELDRVDVRSRDAYGAGFDLRSIRGTVAADGSLERLSGIKIDAVVESLFWKPSAGELPIALPAPLRAEASFAAVKGSGRLAVDRGVVVLGPFSSSLGGSIDLADPEGTTLDLLVRGEPQRIRSEDEAIRSLAARVPARWEAQARWEIRFKGRADAVTQSGALDIEPLRVEAGANRFSLERCGATWTVTPDRRFTLSGKGEGSGVTVELDAHGATVPDGVTQGTFLARGPAQRMNGLVPNAPTWTSGRLEARAVFVLRPRPAAPEVRWTIKGEDLSGVVSSLPRPVSRMSFDLAGDLSQAEIRSFRATVGSTTASVRGTVQRGTPLGRGQLNVTLDRLVAEEWAPPVVARERSATRAAPAAAAVPPVPLESFEANVTVGEVRSGGLSIRNVEVPVRYREGSVAMEPIRGAIGSGSLQGSLRVGDLLSAPHYALKLDLDRAPAEDVMAGFLPFVRGFTGLVNGSVELGGPGLPGPALGDSLRGSLSGSVEQGTIVAGKPLLELRDALGIKSESDLAFRTLRHSLRIERGRLLIDELKGDVGHDWIAMGGSVGFDNSLDLKLLVRLAPERLEGRGTLAELARLARDPDGRLPLEVAIGGTVAAPRVTWKPGRAAAKAGDRLARDLLQGLSAADSVDSAAPDPRQRGRDALRKLIGK